MHPRDKGENRRRASFDVRGLFELADLALRGGEHFAAFVERQVSI
jgi:hypothetical protein